MTNQPETPKIEFPCADYPIKIIGRSAPNFKELVVSIVKQHDPDHDGNAEIKKSRNGKFEAVNVKIHAVSPMQIEALFLDLKATGQVNMVL